MARPRQHTAEFTARTTRHTGRHRGRERAPSGCKKHGECTRNGGCGCRNMRGARARTQMHAASTQGRRQHTEGSKIADASVARWCCGRRKEKRMVRRGSRAEHEGEVWKVRARQRTRGGRNRRQTEAADEDGNRRDGNRTAPHLTRRTLLSPTPPMGAHSALASALPPLRPHAPCKRIGTCAGARPKL